MEKFVKFVKSNLYHEIIIFSFIIGACSGLVASLFYYVLEFMRHFINHYLVGRELVNAAGEHLSFLSIGNGPGLGWLFFILPAVGGLISGLLAYFFAPDATGNGTDAMIDCFHRKKGDFNAKSPLIKAIASIFVISTNGSSGREGPILQVCGGIGSLIAKITKKNTEKRRTYLLAGAAGGLGAIFRAPLGGALTSIEVLYKEDLETQSLVPCIISSVTAYTVFTLIFGHRQIFSVGAIGFEVTDLPFYLILGVICAYTGRLYIGTYERVSKYFSNLKIKSYMKPAIGGLIVGCIALLCPESLGGGFGYIQLSMFGKYTVITFLVIVLTKILTTSFTIGAGASGGVFAPTLTIGAMVGGFTAAAINYIYPGAIAYPSSFIVVGMCAFFAGVASAPIAAVIMVCELTQSYALLPPLLLVAVLSILMSKKSIYKNQVKNKLFSMAHHQETTECMLRQKTVGDVYKSYKNDDIIYEDMEPVELIKLLKSSHNSDFIVVDKNRKLIGGVSFSEYGGLKNLVDQDIENKKMTDLIRNISSVSMKDDLYVALKTFLNENFYKLPVVDSEGVVQGYLRYRDILTAL